MSNNTYFKNNIELWQEYSQAYTDFVFSSMQTTLSQTLAARERVDQVVAETAKKAQALSQQEQELLLGLAETWQAQSKSAAERLGKLFNVESN